MKHFRALFLIAGAALALGASSFGPTAGSRLRSSGGGYNTETNTWISRVDAAGGTYETDSKDIADALIVALRAKSYQAKIVYLLPLLGSNLAAARVPLRDSLNVGIAGSTNFVNGDFSQSTGLQGNGSTKHLDSLIKPSQLGTSNNGGMGYWENNVNLSGNVEPMGCYNNAGTNRYVLDLRSNLRNFRWGNPGNGASDATSAANGHYYGQRASATERKIYFDSSLISTNTTSDSTSGASDRNILILAADESGTIAQYPGRCAVAYLTDGTMSDADVADFHTLLGTYLITPTGR